MDDRSPQDGARPCVPARGGVAALRRAAADCRGCPLYEDAAQTVFGDGPAHARTVVVGEQPGDREDLAGEPFVGPAGHLLRKALADAEIDERDVYFTNAVKHFKSTSAGDDKRRIHKAPGLREMTACRPWLSEELHRIDPEPVLVLGATAGTSVLGNSFKVTESRGTLLHLPAAELPTAARPGSGRHGAPLRRPAGAGQGGGVPGARHRPARGRAVPAVNG